MIVKFSRTELARHELKYLSMYKQLAKEAMFQVFGSSLTSDFSLKYDDPSSIIKTDIHTYIGDAKFVSVLSNPEDGNLNLKLEMKVDDDCGLFLIKQLEKQLSQTKFPYLSGTYINLEYGDSKNLTNQQILIKGTGMPGLNENMDQVYVNLKRAIKLNYASILIDSALSGEDVINKFDLNNSDLERGNLMSQISSFPMVDVPKEFIEYHKKTNNNFKKSLANLTGNDYCYNGEANDHVDLLNNDYANLILNSSNEMINKFKKIFQHKWQKDDFKDKEFLNEVKNELPTYFNLALNDIKKVDVNIANKVDELYKL